MLIKKLSLARHGVAWKNTIVAGSSLVHHLKMVNLLIWRSDKANGNYCFRFLLSSSLLGLVPNFQILCGYKRLLSLYRVHKSFLRLCRTSIKKTEHGQKIVFKKGKINRALQSTYHSSYHGSYHGKPFRV